MPVSVDAAEQEALKLLNDTTNPNLKPATWAQITAAAIVLVYTIVREAIDESS